MPGPTWAEAEVEMDVDGTAINNSLRRLADQAGRNFGQRFASAFNRASSSFDASTRRLMTRFNAELSNSERLVRRLDSSVLKLWKTLPHGFRQFSFYTALFAALGQSIAVLSSAAGAGLFTLLGVVGPLVAGLGVLITGFTNLDGELADLPAEIRPGVQALRDLGTQFAALQRSIQIRLLSNTEGAFRSLGSTISGLEPAILRIADAGNRLIGEFATSIAPGTRAFNDLNRILDRAAPIFERLMRIVGRFGRALLSVFASPAVDRAVNEFLDWLGILVDRFDAFAQSSALDEWFSNASRIFGAVGRLLDSTARMLSDLVTPKAVTNLVALLDHMTNFMPVLGQLLDVLGRLDVFGLIAEGLDAFGVAVGPLIAPLGELADGLNRIIGIALDTWGEDIRLVGEAVAPAIQAIADAVRDVPTDTIQTIAGGLAALAVSLVAIKAASGGIALITGLATAIRGLSTTKVTWKGLLSGLTTAALVAFFTEQFTGAETGTTEAATTFWGSVLAGGFIGATKGGPFGAAVGVGIAAIVSSLSQNWEPISQWWLQGWEDLMGGTWQEQMARDWEAAFGDGTQWETYWNEGPGSLLGKLENGAVQIQTFAQGVRDGVNNFFYGIGAGLATWWDGISTSFAVWRDGFFGGWNAFWGSLPANLLAWLTTMLVGFNTWFGQVTAGFQGWWAGILAGFLGWLAGIAGSLAGWWGSVVAGWNGFWAGVGAAASSAWSFITGLIRGAVNTVSGVINGMINAVRGAWNGFWSGLGGIVSSVWAGITGTIRGAVNSVIGIINGMISAINRALGAISSITGGLVNLKLPNLPRAATGGIAMSPTIAGEAGPEIIIPLNRPLSMVDPSVRGLTALIRGEAGGGRALSGGPQKTVIVESGAVQVFTSVEDPTLVGYSAMDRLVARLG